MSGKNSKTIRRLVKKGRKDIAVDLVKEIYKQSFLFRLKFAFRVVFKR